MPDEPRLILPNDTQRITIIGKTGSGKTQAGAYQLARRSLRRRPWIVFDYKYEGIFRDIRKKEEIGLGDRIPKKPGLYIVHPNPSDEERVEDFMWRIWEHERVGVFIDEGYMVPTRSPAFQAILTQGRSKEIPVIMLTQRPSWVTRFAFSEADYIQCFQLTDTRDKKTVREFMPLPIENDLPAPYHSWWWDNTQNYKAVLRPVPPRDTILDMFKKRLAQPRRVI